MSTRSLDPVILAPMTMSPGGILAPGAGSRLLTIGYRPGEPTGLAASGGDGEGGAANGSSVGVSNRLEAGASVAGAMAWSRAGVLVPTGRAPSSGRSGGLKSQAVTSSSNPASAACRRDAEQMVDVNDALRARRGG